MHGIRYETAIVIGSHVWRGLSVCWSRACTSSAKADELIEMPFAVEERSGNHVIEMGAWIPSCMEATHWGRGIWVCPKLAGGR